MFYKNGGLIGKSYFQSTKKATGIVKLKDLNTISGIKEMPKLDYYSRMGDIDFDTSGLLLYLDTYYENSYNGSSSSWYDISGNNFHMSVKNSPTFVKGFPSYFDLDGVDEYGACDGTVSGSTSANSTNLGVGGSNQKSIVTVFQVDNNVGNINQGLYDLGTLGTNGYHFCLRLSGSYTAWRAQHWGATYDYDFTYDSIGKWTFFYHTYPSDKNNRVYRDNAVLVGQKGTATNLLTQGTTPFSMGVYGGGNYWGGKVALYMVFNTGLSTSQISRIFNSLKKRFKL